MDSAIAYRTRARRAYSIDERTFCSNTIDVSTPAKQAHRDSSIDETMPAKRTRRVHSIDDRKPAKRTFRSNSIDVSTPAKRARRKNSVDEPAIGTSRADSSDTSTLKNLKNMVELNMRLSNEVFKLKNDMNTTLSISSMITKKLTKKSLACAKLNDEIETLEKAIKQLEDERFTDDLVDFTGNLLLFQYNI